MGRCRIILGLLVSVSFFRVSIGGRGYPVINPTDDCKVIFVIFCFVLTVKFYNFLLLITGSYNRSTTVCLTLPLDTHRYSTTVVVTPRRIHFTHRRLRPEPPLSNRNGSVVTNKGSRRRDYVTGVSLVDPNPRPDSVLPCPSGVGQRMTLVCKSGTGENVFVGNLVKDLLRENRWSKVSFPL